MECSESPLAIGGDWTCGVLTVVLVGSRLSNRETPQGHQSGNINRRHPSGWEISPPVDTCGRPRTQKGTVVPKGGPISVGGPS